MLRLRQPRGLAGVGPEPEAHAAAAPWHRHSAAVSPEVLALGAPEVGILALRVVQVDHFFDTELLAVEQVRGAGQSEDRVHRGDRSNAAEREMLGRGHFAVHHLAAVASRRTANVVILRHPRGRRTDERVGSHRRRDDVLPLGAVPFGSEQVEVEAGVQLVGAQVASPLFGRVQPRFGDEHARRVVRVGDLAPPAVHVVHARLVEVRLGVRVEQRRVVAVAHVGISGFFDHSLGHVDADAVDTAVEPEAERVVELADDVGVVPVHIRLVGVEQVQVPPAGLRTFRVEDLRPRDAAEDREPVVGRQFAVVTLAAHAVVALPRRRAGRRGESFEKEPVLAARVVGHHVENHLDAAGVGFAHERFGIAERAEHGVDVAVVRDVVSPVALRARKDRAEPHRVDAEVAQIVEPRDRAGQVADSVAVSVGE